MNEEPQTRSRFAGMTENGADMGFPVSSPELNLSSAHNGFVIYFARVIAPLWKQQIATRQVTFFFLFFLFFLFTHISCTLAKDRLRNLFPESFWSLLSANFLASRNFLTGLNNSTTQNKWGKYVDI
jgi:hypothetical protein